ncbi:MAG: oligosaccharide flippase family protein [Pseudomonadota bacterium]
MGKRSFSTGVAWIAAGNWIEQAIGFALFLVLARMLGAESFGILAMAGVFVTLSEFLVRDSVSEGLLSNPSPTRADLNAAFWLLAGFGAVLFAAVTAAAPALAALYGQPEIARLVPWLMTTVPLIAATAVPVAILRRELRFRALAIRAIAGVVAGGAVGIGMAAAGYGVWSLLGQRLAVVVTNIALAWVAVDWRPGLETDRQSLRRAAHFGGAVAGLRAAELAAAQAPALLLGATLGPVAVGFYTVAWRIVELLSFLIVTPVRVAAQPVFAAISREGGRSSDLLVALARLAGPVGFPLFAGVAILARPFVEVAVGPDWADAAPILAVLSLVGANACIDRVPQAFCLASGRAAAQTAAAWALVLTGAALAALALPWGPAGVVTGFAVAHWIVWPARVFITARIARVPVRALLAPHLAPALLAVPMAGSVALVTGALAPASPAAGLALGVLTGAAVFAALSAVFLRDRLDLLRTFMLDPASAAATDAKTTGAT